MRRGGLTGWVAALAASLAFFHAGAAGAGFAKATGLMTLSVGYDGAARLMHLGDVAGGTKTLSGFGAHSESADGVITSKTPTLWSLQMTDEAIADSPPTSQSDAAWRNALGTIFLLYNDPSFHQDERVNLTLSASVSLSAIAVGPYASAKSTADYEIFANHLGEGLPGMTFAPPLALVDKAPPPSDDLALNTSATWQFFLSPGDTVVVNLRKATLTAHAFTSEVPEPQVWALSILGFGAAGLALRRRRRLAARRA
jgi:hypothetical protein